MSKPNEELDDALYAKVLALSEEGNRLIEEDDNLPAALDAYGEALALLPLPIERWDAALWLLIALGDSHFLLGQYDQAYDFLARAMRCPARGDPVRARQSGQGRRRTGAGLYGGRAGNLRYRGSEVPDLPAHADARNLN
ncbi:MAG: hypothetical protein ACN6N0_09570 [Microvirgula sp.]